MCCLPSGADGGFDEVTTESHSQNGKVKYNMRKSLDLDQEGCFLQAGRKECLEECGFNATAKTIFIIHGWTVRVNQSCVFAVHLFIWFFVDQM